MSSAMSRFTSALLAGSQENTLALATLNFDFSLYKVEAPIEYRDLGQCLSNERRSVAENGSQHIIARKLGALFRSKIPKVPHLIKAYGQRASEIARTTTDSTAKDQGFLAGQIGIDGTTIWAAATSGTEALALQLLACILARFWSAPEAVSIWAEIVEVRKQELAGQAETFDLPEIAAMQANLSREQLADWDASARAWLRSADSAKYKEWTQLRVIVSNIDAPVNNHPTLYDNVIDAWISAMTTIDNLIAGIPQSVYDAAALVSLSAWHLYPDMVIYENGHQEINQADKLFSPGGILTVGLQSSPSLDVGVRWSLPLAKLRYYGHPVQAVKRMDSRSSRVTFSGILLVALGALFNSWLNSHSYRDICMYYSLLWDCIKELYSHGGSWLSHVAAASITFLESKDAEQTDCIRLLDFGFRRCGSFLSTMGEQMTLDSQLLHMHDPTVFISYLRPHCRIEFLRQLAEEIGHRTDKSKDWIIVYKNDRDYSHSFTTAVFDNPQLRHTNYPTSTSPHHIWVESRSTGVWERGHPRTSSSTLDSNLVNDLKGWTVSFEASAYRTLQVSGASSSGDEKSSGRFDKAVLTFKSARKDLREDDLFASTYCPDNIHTQAKAENFVRFEYVVGSADTAALYRRQPKFGPRGQLPKTSKVTFDRIIEGLKKQELDPVKLVHGTTAVDDSVWRPLQALGFAAQIYDNLRGATISMNATSSALERALWTQSLVKRRSIDIRWSSSLTAGRSTAFSCIVFLETGDTDLDPSQLQSVMAISVCDSIYLAAAIMLDPFETPKESQIHRALGNVGKPGVSLMIPPPAPTVREVKNDEWYLIDHNTYDTTVEDSFQKTSIHLSLTDYRVPYATSHEGVRDIQVFFQEAIVSVYDGSKWVGDINILSALASDSTLVQRPSNVCPHWSVGDNYPLAKPLLGFTKSSESKITSIDNWHELLDKPRNPAIVRAYDNWLGRLAAAALSAQLENHTIILPTKPCRKCFGNYEFLLGWIPQGVDVIIY